MQNNFNDFCKNKEVSITEPYNYEIDGKNVLLTTVSSPVYYKGKFVGAVGVDFSLDFFNKKIAESKKYFKQKSENLIKKS